MQTTLTLSDGNIIDFGLTDIPCPEIEFNPNDSSAEDDNSAGSSSGGTGDGTDDSSNTGSGGGSNGGVSDPNDYNPWEFWWSGWISTGGGGGDNGSTDQEIDDGDEEDNTNGCTWEEGDDPSECTCGSNSRYSQINLKSDANAENPCIHTGVVAFLIGQIGLSDGQVNWLTHIDRAFIYDDIINFLNVNNYDEQAIAFVQTAIDALIDGGEVDFFEKKINGIKLDPSLPACLENMILDLMLGNFPYSETMGNIELIENTFNVLGTNNTSNPIGIVVNYKVDNITGNGETTGQGYDPSTQSVYIDVTIDEDLVHNGTKLALIKTILHESIHAYLLVLQNQYPSYFNTSNEFSQLIIDYQNYTNSNDPQHIYMAKIINDMANNVSNFVQEKYGYPPATIDYYEAVCWSGLTHLTDGSLNPLFSNNYPNSFLQNNIISIFNTENGTAHYPGYSPLINNNCN